MGGNMPDFLLRPPDQCESCAYLLLDEKAFPPDATLRVPAGYEAVVWTSPDAYVLHGAGDYPLNRDLQRRRIGFGKSELVGAVGFLNKAAWYQLFWGTGPRVVYQDLTLAKPCEVGFSGSLTLRLDMSDLFLKSVRRTGAARVTLEGLATERLPAFSGVLNLSLRGAIAQMKLDFRGVAGGLPDISAAAEPRLREVFLPLGLWMEHFNIENCIFSDEVEEMLC
jgi:hypothetical protein